MSGLTPDHERLRRLLREHSLKFGDFLLASGQRSRYYFDSKRTTLLPEGAYLAALEVLHTIRRRGIEADAIGGMTLGADPIVCPVAALTSSRSKLPVTSGVRVTRIKVGLITSRFVRARGPIRTTSFDPKHWPTK